MKNLTYKISIPTDNGFWGRECKKCEKYFKVDSDQVKEEMYCPYCGEFQENKDMWTKSQTREVDKIAHQIGKRFIEDELDKMFKNLARGSKNMTYKPGRRTQVSKPTSHLEKEVDSEIECPSCQIKFQVYGIFGFCPGCKEDNVLIYEANLQIILTEIENSANPKRSLRHAYKDLVTTFELYCKRIARIHDLGNPNFQNLLNAKKFFKKQAVDIYNGIEYNEKLTLKRIFEKRHAYEHGPGEITESYIKNIPEDSNLIGQVAELSKDEFILGVTIMKKVIKNIREKFSS